MKTIISILFICLANQVCAIDLSGNFKAGFTNMKNTNTDHKYLHQFYADIYTASTIKINKTNLVLFNEIETWSVLRNLNNYDPFRVNYTIGVTLNIGNVGLGIKHQCSHPVFSNYTSMIESIWVGEYNLLFIEIGLR